MRLGSQEPLYQLVPPAKSSAGQDAIDLAASAGLILDPWQQLVLDGALGEAPGGKWAAAEVGLIVPRQNGKGGILEARELAGLFLFNEQLILHSAHEFKTASEAFRRLLLLIQSTPDLDKEVARVRTSHGDEGIELKTGQRLRFVARSTGSGRGFTGDCIILDEAYNLPAAAMAALVSTMAARSMIGSPQIWYTSSAPLPRPESDTLRRLCRRGRTGSRRDRLAYFEWSAPLRKTKDRADWDKAVAKVLDDPEATAQANPALGIRIDADFITTERGALEDDDYARERLGLYPEAEEALEPAIDPADWQACLSTSSEIVKPVVYAFEVSIDRKWGVIGAAGASSEYGTHVEIGENRPGTGWMVDRLIELRDTHGPAAIVCNPAGPAAGLLPECERRGLEVGLPQVNESRKRTVHQITSADYKQACQAAYDDITEHRWRHLGQPELSKAVKDATRRVTGDSWVFDRRGDTDISPLVAVALAAWAAGRSHEVPTKTPTVHTWDDDDEEFDAILRQLQEDDDEDGGGVHGP